MKNTGHDLGFIVVPNPRAGKFDLFNWLYPKWFKIGQFLRRIKMGLRNEMKSVNNPIVQNRKFN